MEKTARWKLKTNTIIFAHKTVTELETHMNWTFKYLYLVRYMCYIHVKMDNNK